MPDIRGLISDPEFASLPAPRKQAVLQKAGANPQFIAEYLGGQAAQAPPEPEPAGPQSQHPLAGFGKGVLKGAAGTALGLGRMVASAGGLGELSPEQETAFRPETWGMGAETPAERLGKGIEQGAEFLAVPGPGKLSGLTTLAKAAQLAKAGVGAAGLTRAQGSSPGMAAASGVVMAAGGPVGEYVASKATPLVRAAIKPTVAALKRISGSTGQGLDAKANALVQFIIENRVTTATKARDIFTQAERDLQRTLALKNAPTDAATRAMKYLDALEKSATKGALSGEKVAVLRGKMSELLEGSMGEVIGQSAAGPVRGLRQAVPAAEALASARASSRWSTGGKWGQTDTPEAVKQVAEKAVERAQRDAVKAAVPEAVPLLKRESQALTAEGILDRMGTRAANRDVVSLPAWVVAGPAMAAKSPAGGVLALAANWLRNNQLKAGIWADSLGKAIQKGDAARVAMIFERIGEQTVQAQE